MSTINEALARLQRAANARSDAVDSAFFNTGSTEQVDREVARAERELVLAAFALVIDGVGDHLSDPIKDTLTKLRFVAVEALECQLKERRKR